MITKKISMDAPISTSDDGSLLDVLPNKNSPDADAELLEAGLKKEIERALVALPEREQIILRGYFGINQREMSLEDDWCTNRPNARTCSSVKRESN